MCEKTMSIDFASKTRREQIKAQHDRVKETKQDMRYKQCQTQKFC